GLLGKLQRMEYTRYARDVDRSRRVWVLTGTATLHRVGVLQEVAEARGRSLHGGHGDVYDRTALTEDMEITLGVKILGYRCVSPAACTVVTEVMPTVRDLWRQRLRWQRGALENLHVYGISRITLPYLGQQALMILSIVAMWLYAVCTGLSIWTGTIGFSPAWSSIGLIFVVERVVTVWRGGALARGIAAILVIEMVYAMFLQAVFVAAARAALSRRPAAWHHVSAVEGR
ncbi:MAG: glycosyltransferase, partial [Nocardioidaceae bacterium]